MFNDSLRTFEDWRSAARPLLASRVPSESVAWNQVRADDTHRRTPADPALRLPRTLMSLLKNVSMYRDGGRWELMYRLAWRTLYENPGLLEDAADRDVARALRMDRAVRRDCHKMHAFVRFREISAADREPVYFSWFEPEHEVLRNGAEFFLKRFPNMLWTIATPDGAAVWDLTDLSFVATPLAPRPNTDCHEQLWRTYYRSICNVARVNPSAMLREMPQRYWRHLPEAAEIGLLIRDGVANFDRRHQESFDEGGTMAKAVKRSLSKIPPSREGPQSCRRCDLWKHATQAVEGEGPSNCKIMLVGEQPGDEEDLRGHPFVGPAGTVLDAAIAAAGLDRKELFVTNAVKHFKWEPRGKRRLHKKPDAGEIKACHVWLEHEIAERTPRVIVALGASALRALIGSTASVDKMRRQHLESPGGARVLATYHPAAILRTEGGRSEELRCALVEDLIKANALASK